MLVHLDASTHPQAPTHRRAASRRRRSRRRRPHPLRASSGPQESTSSTFHALAPPAHALGSSPSSTPIAAVTSAARSTPSTALDLRLRHAGPARAQALGSVRSWPLPRSSRPQRTRWAPHAVSAGDCRSLPAAVPWARPTPARRACDPVRRPRVVADRHRVAKQPEDEEAGRDARQRTWDATLPRRSS